MSAERPWSSMRVALAGGGTGGHIVPGRHLLSHTHQDLGDVLWFCTGRPVESKAFAGLEHELGKVPMARVALSLEPDGGGAPSLARLALRNLPCYRKALRELRDHRTQLVLGLGGFTCLPVVLAAWSLKLPIALLEINAAKGRATRSLAPLATRVFHAWRGTLPGGRESERDLWTGPPLAPSFAAGAIGEGEAQRARSQIGFDAQRPLVLILGGSQGAGALNRFVATHVDEFLRRGVQVLHQTGPGRLDQGAPEKSGYRKVEFVVDVHTALSAATLVLCRGGASTLAEVAAMRRAAWVVPYPHHKDQHQRKNALELGAGVQIVEEERLSKDLACELVQKTTPTGLSELERRSAALAQAMALDGAQRIWSELVKVVALGRRESRANS
ncbi:MAG: UDP-N-acetylglucosamine--N-acetylmuramyl-(pentapeptide) pyrophosphoryl-undecaprenol N-acetylglucosamine transferase [Planctomycetes bacterium]|nr:UDP-N-acetylglucosamine--N-acetylmuramyl-(pentapeptide) pyrophosphoryl-undecaprenol N-acetylglucosamine transferase [Planctomycetota bacterium]